MSNKKPNIFFLCLLLLLSAPLSHALQNDQCLKFFTKSCAGPQTISATMLRAECEAKRREKKCDQLFNLATPQEQKKFYSCATEDGGDLCAQQDQQGVALMYSCGQGAGGVIWDTAVGLVLLPKTVWDLIQRKPEMATAYKSCSENLDAKLALLGDMKPADMTAESIQRMSCGEIKKFTQAKAEIILSRLEERRLQKATLDGNENVRIEDLVLSEKEKQALNYDLKKTAPLRQAQCFRYQDAVQSACQVMTGNALSFAGGLGAISLVRKLTTKSALAVTAKIDAPIIQAKAVANTKAVEKVVLDGPVKPTDAILNVNSFKLTDAAKIDPSQLSNFRKIPTTEASGVRNISLTEATLNNEKVFIKETRVNQNGTSDLGVTYDGFVNEVAWTQRLSDLGVGPKFKGYTVSADGRYSIVTEYVEGTHVGMQFPDKIYLSAKVKSSPEVIESLEKIKNLIQTEKINFGDFQLRISNTNKAVVIDPEYARPATTVGQVNDGVKAINNLIAELKKKNSK